MTVDDDERKELQGRAVRAQMTWVVAAVIVGLVIIVGYTRMDNAEGEREGLRSELAIAETRLDQQKRCGPHVTLIGDIRLGYGSPDEDLSMRIIVKGDQGVIARCGLGFSGSEPPMPDPYG